MTQALSSNGSPYFEIERRTSYVRMDISYHVNILWYCWVATGFCSTVMQQWRLLSAKRTWRPIWPTHRSTQRPTDQSTDSPIDRLTYRPIHEPTNPPADRPSYQVPTHWPTDPFTRRPIHSPTHPPTNPPTHPTTHRLRNRPLAHQPTVVSYSQHKTLLNIHLSVADPHTLQGSSSERRFVPASWCTLHTPTNISGTTFLWRSAPSKVLPFPNFRGTVKLQSEK